MAKANPSHNSFEDLVFCPVCMEVYKEPQSLLCRHTLCLNCVLQLSKNEEIKCPICRKNCKRKDIACDYNTAKYVEFYNVNELDEMSNWKKCQACCVAAASPDVRLCFACSQYMCLNIGQDPTSKSAQQLVKVIRASLKQVKWKLEEKKDVFTTWLEYVQGQMWKLKQVENMVTKWNETIIGNLHVVEELINAEKEADIIEKGTRTNHDMTYVLESLNAQVQNHHALLSSLGLNTHTVDDFMQPLLLNTLPETVNAVATNTTYSIYQPSHVQLPLSPLKIERPILLLTPPPKGFTQAVLNTPGYTSRTTYSLSELAVEGSAYSLNVTNDRLLLVSDGCVNVYDRDCKLQNKITLSNCDGCRNVVKRGAGPEANMVVSGANGLTVVNMKGRVKDKIATETVHHLTTQRHHIYALNRGTECGSRAIDKYEKYKSWHKIETFTVKHKNPTEHDTLGVFENNFFVGSFANHCINVFNSTGELISRYGKYADEEKGMVAGRFNSPRLVNIDSNGYLLIADVGNKRIQQRSTLGKWSVVSTEVGSPWDVVVDDNIMWVLTREGQLLKFTKGI